MFILVAVLLSATDADRFLSLGRKKTTAGEGMIPRWQPFILQAQVVIVYFYGGLTKLKADWLFRQEPVTTMVHNMTLPGWLAPYFQTDFTIGLLTYGGFLLDILAPLLLWYKPVRRWALVPFVLFHLSNSRIFDDIGIFPFVMLSALILFFETHEIPGLRRLAKPNASGGRSAKSRANRACPGCLLRRIG
ncbi:MAG: HTTM domain-containing protein [Lewinellaceae bacterium]|nr:HTTM domain-containing protein [Lewinellaceae bacterium]